MDGKYQQAMGIAIECRRLDKLEEAIMKSDNVQGALSYCINVSHSYVNRREYRQEVGLFASFSISIYVIAIAWK
jgi:26S proteasome regulatory subunit N2